MHSVEQRRGGGALDRPESAGDDDAGRGGLVLGVDVDVVAVLGDQHLELGDLGERERVGQARCTEDQVVALLAAEQAVEVDADVLLGALALLGLGVATVDQGTADGALVVVVAGRDHALVGVEDSREGVEVDGAATHEAAALGTPGDVEPLGAGENRVGRADLVEVEGRVERVLGHVDAGLGGPVAEGVVAVNGHFCRSILSHVREG